MQQGKYSSKALGVEQETPSNTDMQNPKGGKYSSKALGIETENKTEKKVSSIFNKPPEDIGVLEAFSEFVTGKLRETPETQSLPEIGQFEGLSNEQVIKVGAGLLTTLNPEAQKDIIKNSIPGATFRDDEKGNVIIVMPDGEEAVLNKPGASQQDLLQLSTQIMSYVPAGRLASLPNKLWQKMFVGGGGAALTNYITQKLSQTAGSEQPVDKGEVALAGGLGVGAELIVPAVQGIRNIRRSKRYNIEADDFDNARPDVLEAQEATEEIAKLSPTGERVGLTQPQQTLNPNQIAQARSVGESEAGSRVARKVIIRQNDELNNAVNNVLDTIAPPTAIENAAEATQKAATGAIDGAKAAREAAASPLYEKAFNGFKGVVPIKGVRDLILSIRKGAANDGQLKRTLNQTLKLLKGTPKIVDGKEVITPPTLKQLHNAKIEIGDMIDGTGGKPLSNTIKRELTRVLQRLTEVLKTSSDDYKKAAETFEEMSPAVDELVNSKIGKIADKKELKNLSEMIFDAQEINPAIMKKVKSVIREKDPQVWNDILRLHLEKKIGKIRSETGVQGLPNTPAKLLSAIYGNEAQTKILLDAASPALKRNLIYLRTILTRAKEARPGGSDTSVKTAAREARSVNKFLDWLFSPLETAKGIGKQGAQRTVDKNLANSLFDTKFITKMNKFRKLPPDSPAATRALNQLLDDVQPIEDN